MGCVSFDCREGGKNISAHTKDLTFFNDKATKLFSQGLPFLLS